MKLFTIATFTLMLIVVTATSSSSNARQSDEQTIMKSKLWTGRRLYPRELLRKRASKSKEELQKEEIAKLIAEFTKMYMEQQQRQAQPHYSGGNAGAYALNPCGGLPCPPSKTTSSSANSPPPPPAIQALMNPNGATVSHYGYHSYRPLPTTTAVTTTTPPSKRKEDDEENGDNDRGDDDEDDSDDEADETESPEDDNDEK
ncbi:MAG: hypothetical protein EXX96DRAFT_564559 [Benjaminiella poitrasii]|nr:MAG: hypothetical protein EXX96DRAFT_564559 [Benjaminiella poitrasii]